MMRQGAIRAPHKDRGCDLYETPECAIQALLRTGVLDRYTHLFEPCAGRGAISRVLRDAGFLVTAHDLVAYEGADKDIQGGIDFFCAKVLIGIEAIVTNPPFKDADRFIRKGLSLGVPVFMLLRLMALEGAGRSDLIDNHLYHVFIGVERLPMMHRAGWGGRKLKEGAMPFGWFVFAPTPKGYPFFSASRISWRGEANAKNSRRRSQAHKGQGRLDQLGLRHGDGDAAEGGRAQEGQQ